MERRTRAGSVSGVFVSRLSHRRMQNQWGRLSVHGQGTGQRQGQEACYACPDSLRSSTLLAGANAMEMKVYAERILKLLAERHKNDVFVSECKSGESMGQSHLRLDAWALKKSWAKRLAVGYEIKVSRSDFINDTKWMEYLPYCNEFYFVSPWQMVQPAEVGEGAGLMWITATGGRLHIKRKAPYRDVTIPEDLYRYILMYRTKIVESTYGRTDTVSAQEYWRAWMEKKEVDREFGCRVSRAVRQRLEQEVYKVQAENARLIKENESLARVKDVLFKMGLFEKANWLDEYVVQDRIDEMNALLPSDLTERLATLRDTLNGVLKSIEHHKKTLAEGKG